MTTPNFKPTARNAWDLRGYLLNHSRTELRTLAMANVQNEVLLAVSVHGLLGLMEVHLSFTPSIKELFHDAHTCLRVQFPSGGLSENMIPYGIRMKEDEDIQG